VASTSGVPASAAAGRAWVLVSVGALAAAAWLTLGLADGAAHGGFLHAHGHAHRGGSPVLAGAIFVFGWSVMTVAMMLPTSLPVLIVYDGVARSRPDRVLLLGLVVAGYLATWAALGAVVHVAGLGVQALVSASPWLGERSSRAAPLLLVVAGLFQLSPLKYRCLDKCRSPVGAVIRHWRGHHYRRQALKLGLDHGLYCVGCCWALMLLMFAVGTGRVMWMLILATLMVVEKNVSWGRRMAAPVGVALVAWGAAWLIVEYARGLQ